MSNSTPSENVFDLVLLGEIEAMLEKLLPAAAGQVEGLNRIGQAMRYSALAGGKRLRPYLLVRSADLFDVPRTQAIRTGCALEFIHCYSLIHDDLPAMDDSDLRRGKATSHKAYGEATAILAGDGLLTDAFALLADPKTHEQAQIRIILIAELAKAAGSGGMVGGQMMDILAENGEAVDHDISLLQSLKTGALISYACRAGGYLGDAPATSIAQLENYAQCLGLAFQITDDLLDVTSSAELAGKPVQQDMHMNKSTFVDLLGVAGARAKASALVAQGKEALSDFGPKAAPLSKLADFVLHRQV